MREKELAPLHERMALARDEVRSLLRAKHLQAK